MFELVGNRCMSMDQLSALQNVHLWGCLSLQELNVCVLPIKCTQRTSIARVFEFKCKN